MTADRRRTRLLLLALLLLAGFVWLLWPAATDEGQGPSTGSEPGVPGEVSLLHGEGAEAHPADGTLKGRAREDGAAAKRGDVRVRVVGRGDVPIPGALVKRTRRDGGWSWDRRGALTDGRGLAVLGDLPYDGSMGVVCFQSIRQRYGKGVGLARAAVTGPTVLLRTSTGILLVVRAVDAETGRDLKGVRPYMSHQPTVTVTAPGGTAPARYILFIGAGTIFRGDISLREPAGWVESDQATTRVIVSPYADELTAIRPLRREMDVSVTPIEPDGSIASARVSSVWLGGQELRCSASADAHGCLRVRGVPFLRHEVLTVVVARQDGTGAMQIRAALPEQRSRPLDLRVTLPDPTVREILDSVEVDNDLPFEEDLGLDDDFDDDEDPPEYDNEVVVRVRRRNGDPAIGASVHLDGVWARSDERGLARFKSIEPGLQSLFCRQPGLLRIESTVQVPAAGKVEAALREGADGTVLLSVVDDDGRPLAFASFKVEQPSSAPWVDLDGTNQRVDRFTDHRGQRTLRRLEPGRVRLQVRWGARRIVQEVEVKEGRDAYLRVVLPAPKPPTGPPTPVWEGDVEEEVVPSKSKR